MSRFKPRQGIDRGCLAGLQVAIILTGVIGCIVDGRAAKPSAGAGRRDRRMPACPCGGIADPASPQGRDQAADLHRRDAGDVGGARSVGGAADHRFVVHVERSVDHHLITVQPFEFIEDADQRSLVG
jgi:hypothetical protein